MVGVSVSLIKLKCSLFHFRERILTLYVALKVFWVFFWRSLSFEGRFEVAYFWRMRKPYKSAQWSAQF